LHLCPGWLGCNPSIHTPCVAEQTDIGRWGHAIFWLGLDSNHNPPGFCLLSSEDYRHEPQHQAIHYNFHNIKDYKFNSLEKLFVIFSLFV
jgi:hypothetical protein